MRKERVYSLRWLGHVVWREEEYIGRRVRKMKIARRKSGRPRKRWEDCFREDMVDVTEQLAKDGPELRRRICTGELSVGKNA